MLADPFMRGELPAIAAPSRAPDETGLASTYGRARDSHRQAFMASAEHVRVDPTMHVCAHRSRRFGTVLVIQSERTGRVTACKVTDRGPYGCVTHDTGERINSAVVRDRPCTHRGILDLGPGVRAELGPGDGGLHPVRVWAVFVPPRAVHVRRPSS